MITVSEGEGAMADDAPFGVSRVNDWLLLGGAIGGPEHMRWLQAVSKPLPALPTACRILVIVAIMWLKSIRLAESRNRERRGGNHQYEAA